MAGASTRHKWGERQPFMTKGAVPYHFKTERQCARCGVVKVSRHEPDDGPFGRHWVEFWDGLDQLAAQGGAVPRCDARLEAVQS
jgi:hypothetical protein